MILSKLRSRKGASLIVALFLLIVCSTVGSIILTAATANVGRISERAEYDRKYYEVISAARLFADKIAESELTLTIALQGGAASIACADSAADSELSNILRNDILRIYKGSDALTPATAAQYLRETFSNIGRDADYSESAPTAFAMTVREGDADTPALSTVYGRFAVEATRMKGDINSSLDSVEHNVTAVFYSDEDTENPNQIPEDAYVVKLTCSADTVPVSPTSFFEDPATESVEGTMSIQFKWPRANMTIEQVRGVA